VLLAAMVALVAGGLAWWHRAPPHYLDEDYAPFVALFAAPPARGSAEERAELELLLQLQRARTPEEVRAAQADRKTEISRFAQALGGDPRTIASLPRLALLADHVEDDIRGYVRAAKRHFRRLRPREIEPGIQPCIGDVAADLSYPSGHATFAYTMGYLLADMVPERRDALLARAAGFARQRMVCGVHFPSDVAAGRLGADWLMQRLRRSPSFLADRERAAEELRAALHLPPAAQRSGHSSARRAPPRRVLEAAVTRPRCNAAMRATIASPSPYPPVSRLRLVSSRVKAWNTEARCASGMPSPSSSTTRRQVPCSRATSMVTVRRA
jgi:acid phosphatase (class A)